MWTHDRAFVGLELWISNFNSWVVIHRTKRLTKCDIAFPLPRRTLVSFKQWILFTEENVIGSGHILCKKRSIARAKALRKRDRRALHIDNRVMCDDGVFDLGVSVVL